MIRNKYKIDEINIEFVKDFRKQYMSMNNIHLPTEFSRKDPVTYIKIKGRDLWLYEKNQQLYFNKIESNLFYKYRQPYVLWINYLGNNTFILYKQLGYGLNNVIGHIYDRNTNVIYMNYTQHNNTISIRWTNDIRFATRFVYDIITWNDFSWIRSHRDLYGRLLYI